MRRKRNKQLWLHRTKGDKRTGKGPSINTGDDLPYVDQSPSPDIGNIPAGPDEMETHPSGIDFDVNAIVNANTDVMTSAVNVNDNSNHAHDATVTCNDADVAALENEFISNSVEQLSDIQMLNELCLRLNEENLLYDFITLVRSIANGSMPADNISFRCALDTGRLYNTKTTTNMRYPKASRKWWELVREVGGGRIIRLFQGPKHMGHLTVHNKHLGIFLPQDGLFNFAVPDINILRKTTTNIGNQIPPGFIQAIIQFIDKSKQYNLGLDGKKCIPQLGKNLGEGDVHLCGFEEPSLEDQKKSFEHDLQIIQNLRQTFNDDATSLDEDIRYLGAILQIMSRRIKRQRTLQVTQERRRWKQLKEVKNNQCHANKYVKAHEYFDAFNADSNKLIADILQLNLQICSLLTKLNLNAACRYNFPSVKFPEFPNFHKLLPVESNDRSFLLSRPELVTQRSDLWHELRSKSKVTGSTINKALCLRRLKDQNEHVQVHIKGMPAAPIPADIQAKMDHGAQHEKYATATVISILMPAILPSCCHLFEVGCYFIPTAGDSNFAEISPDGIIKCTEQFTHNCSSVTGTSMPKGVLEIKCPIPDNNRVLPVHYSIPTSHICQVLSEMAASNSEICWFVSYSRQSTTLCICEFDERLWKSIWNKLKRHYNKDEPDVIKKYPEYIGQVQEDLKRYAKEKCTFVMEVPSVQHVTEYASTVSDIHYPGYAKRLIEEPDPDEEYSISDLIDELQHVCDTAETLLKRSLKLERQTPNEVFMFVINDIDRLYNTKHLQQLPVAYALKPPTLNTETLRKVVNYVTEELNRNGVQLISHSYDGQWIKLAQRSDKGQPLTLLQLQKDVWQNIHKASRSTLLQCLLQETRMTEDLYELWSLNRNIKLSFLDNNIHWKVIWSNLPTDLKSTLQSFQKKHQQLENIPKLDMYTMLQNCKDTASGIQDAVLHDLTSTEIRDNILQDHQDFVQTFLHSLQQVDKRQKWIACSCRQIMQMMSSATSINTKFTSKELDILSTCLKNITGTNIFENAKLKRDKIYILCEVLHLEYKDPTEKKLSLQCPGERIQSLKCLSLRKIWLSKYLLLYMVSKMRYAKALHDWHSSAIVPTHLTVGEYGYKHNVYCLPVTVNSHNGLPIFQIIDASHTMTNLRTHFTRKRVFGCDPLAFKRACERNPNHLHYSVIKLNLDQQNVSIAEAVFSEEMEEAMERNGDTHEAKCVNAVRNWFQACNARGIHIKARIRSLINMQRLILAYHSFEKFPCPSALFGGLPEKTFEALCISISVRLQIYQFVDGFKLNTRSLGTLSPESFYSDVSVRCLSPNGVPGSFEFRWVLAKLIKTHALKVDPTTCFHARTTRRTIRPENELDYISTDEYTDSSEDEMLQHENTTVVQFRNHPFDREHYPKNVRRRKKTDINPINRYTRGFPSVRQQGRFKFNESVVPLMQRRDT